MFTVAFDESALVRACRMKHKVIETPLDIIAGPACDRRWVNDLIQMI
jgi:hypothetical protein